ncbi:allantoinase AllB [Thorsellia kenyensis]|uniref:Allantoinase n=1 Tax=Thorsellia kenyensis TaxID=1549888 RepID=A0ABV6C8Q3_9GAMM
MKYDMLIKNGMVVLENDALKLDIAIKQGKIVALGHELGDARQTIDASGQIVMPGMVDPHMHISEPGRTEWEGYKTAGRAAAKGGVTTLIEMPLNQLPATVDGPSLAAKFEAANNKLTVDIALFGGLVQNNLDKLHELEEGGVVAYKCFVATCGDKTLDNDFSEVNDYDFFKGVSQIAEFNSLIAVHAENAAICDGLGREAIVEKRLTAKDYVNSRPVFAEVEAIRRVLYLAKIANCAIHICHVSSPEGVEEVTKARAQGQDATCESCPHYFTISTEEFAQIGTLAKCSPPLRDKNNQKRLWDKLFAGEIDFLGSDHSPCLPHMKEGNMMEAWGGIAGVQNSLDLMFDEAVQKRGMSLVHFSKLMATNAANRFKLRNKGSIALGKDADIAIIAPNSSYTLKHEDLEYRHKLSPYVGRTINAQIIKTIRRGEVIYDIYRGVIENTQGRFILKHQQ